MRSGFEAGAIRNSIADLRERIDAREFEELILRQQDSWSRLATSTARLRLLLIESALDRLDGERPSALDQLRIEQLLEELAESFPPTEVLADV